MQNRQIRNIIFGNFSEFGGSIDIDKNAYNIMIKIAHNKFHKIHTKIYKVYVHNNLELQICNGDKKVISYYPITCDIYDKYCVNTFKREILDNHEFPFLDKYHDITKRKITTYAIDKKSIILFIEENNIRKVILEFFDKNSSLKNIEIAKSLFQNVSFD